VPAGRVPHRGRSLSAVGDGEGERAIRSPAADDANAFFF
jgi:hypothetical protein